MVNDGTTSFFQEYIKKATCMRLSQYCRKTPFTIKDCDETSNSNALSEEMSIIMLWSSVGSIILKIHFNMKMATKLASITLGRDESEISSKVAREFCTEISNMQASYMRGVLEKHDIYFGMSLPFLVAGEDEVIFRKVRDPRASTSVWKLCSDDNELICTSEVMLFESNPFEKIRSMLEIDIVDVGNKATGDVVFL